MPTYGTFGIFRGGAVSKDANASAPAFLVEGMLVRTPAGKMVGIGANDGQYARRIRVVFGATIASSGGFDWDASRLGDFDLPLYELRIPSDQAGSVYLVFDHTVNEIRMISAVATSFTILAQISWPVGAAAMTDLTLNVDVRNVSLLEDATNPLAPSEYYANGMDWSDANFNSPLVAFGVMGQVMQGESRARFGDSYEHLTLKSIEIAIDPVQNAVTFPRFEVFARSVVGGADTFRHFDTQQPITYAVDDYLANIGRTIYIGMNPGTATLVHGYDAPPAGSIPICHAFTRPDHVKLADTRFIVESEVPSNNLQTGTEVAAHAARYPTGFQTPVRLQPQAGVRKVQLLANTLYLNGYAVAVPATEIDLGMAPATERLDFLYMKMRRRVEPVPPLNGEFYVQLAGSGYAFYEARVETVTGVQYKDLAELMLNEAFAPSTQGDGSYWRSDISELADFKSYDGNIMAVPLGFVSNYADQRDGSGAPVSWSPANPASGHDRWDRKSHEEFHTDEIEVVAPVAKIESSLSDAKILGGILDALLTGAPTMLGRVGIDGYQTPYSKHPCQVDVITSDPSDHPGAGILLPPDGLRRQWSAMPTEHWIGTSFKVQGDITAPGGDNNALMTYINATQRLIINVPEGVDLVLQSEATDDTSAIAEVDIRWADAAGNTVQITGDWVASPDGRMVSNTLDAADANFPDGVIKIAVLGVKVKGKRDSFLSQTPREILRATFDGVGLVAANVNEPRADMAFPDGSGIDRITPIGNPEKGDASTFVLTTATVVQTDGREWMEVPLAMKGMPAIAVSLVEKLTPDGYVSLPIELQKRDDTRILVGTFEVLSPNDNYRVSVAMGGRIMNYRPDVHGAQEFARTMDVSGPASGEEVSRMVLDAARTTSDYTILLGAFSYPGDVMNPNQLTAGVWIDDVLYRASVTGVDSNMLTVGVAISVSQFNGLSVEKQANWVQRGAVYVPRANVTLSVPVLLSAPPKGGEDVVIAYKTSALGVMPLTELPGNPEMEIVHRGYVVASSDSIANVSDSALSPISERLPITRFNLPGRAGTLYAPDITPRTSMRDAAIDHAQMGVLPVEGRRFKVGSDISMDVFVEGVGSGFAFWCPLVRIDRSLYLFVYVVDSGALNVSAVTNAFLVRPLASYAV